MFCGCSADYASASPELRTSAQSAWDLPGALPVINQRAIELIALNRRGAQLRINPVNVISPQAILLC